LVQTGSDTVQAGDLALHQSLPEPSPEPSPNLLRNPVELDLAAPNVSWLGCRKVSEKVSEKGLRRKVSGRLLCSQVRFSRVPEKVPEKVGAEPDQVQQDLQPFNSRKSS